MASLLTQLSQITCIFSSGIFTGSNIYIAFVGQPARMQQGTNLAATVFPGIFDRGSALQIPSYLIATVTAAVAWLTTGDFRWLIVGLSTLAVFPWTVMTIVPPSEELKKPKIDRDAPSTRRLLEVWDSKHAVRMVFSIFSFLLVTWLGVVSK